MWVFSIMRDRFFSNSTQLNSEEQKELKKEYLEECSSEAAADEMLRLVDNLNKFSEDSLLISIGCGMGQYQKEMLKEQQIPTYVKDLANNQSIRILLIDGFFSKTEGTAFVEKEHKIKKIDDKENMYIHQEHPNLKIQIFACYLPSEKCDKLYEVLKHTMAGILEKGGCVFIGNHTQAYSLADIPRIAQTYNKIKKDHPNASALQLYTQGGTGRVRFYGEKLYDEKTSGVLTPFESENFEDFYTCASVANLKNYSEFQSKPEGKSLKS